MKKMKRPALGIEKVRGLGRLGGNWWFSGLAFALELVVAAAIGAAIAFMLREMPFPAAVCAGIAGLAFYKLQTTSPSTFLAKSLALSLFTAAVVSLQASHPSALEFYAAAAMMLCAGACFLAVSYMEESRRSRLEKFAALQMLDSRNRRSINKNQQVVLGRALLAQSQRYKRALSILYLRWPPSGRAATALDGRDAKIVRGIERHLQRFEISSLVQSNIRRSDVCIAGSDGNVLIVVCPDTPASGAGTLARRLASRVVNETGDLLSFTTSSYPEDGYSFEELVSAAANRSDSEIASIILNGSRPAPEPKQAANSGSAGLPVDPAPTLTGVGADFERRETGALPSPVLEAERQRVRERKASVGDLTS